MASIKEIQQSARPLVHRPSAALNNAAALRQSHSRSCSHSVLAPSLNSTSHRVTRRKSITSSGANRTAMVAALKEAGTMPLPTMAMPITISSGPGGGRPNTLSSKPAVSQSVGGASLPSPPPSLPLPKLTSGNNLDLIMDGTVDDEVMEMADSSGNEDGRDQLDEEARTRRASGSQPPSAKEGGGSRKFNRPELYCEQCRKRYKHSSCLTKHLWEHTPEWSYTSKLLISKHQQVQLLEAARVLVAMNTDPSAEQPAVLTPPESAQDAYSDQDPLSPAASSSASYEDQQDRSSVGTTPPPQEGPDFSTSYTFVKMQAADFARPLQSALSGFGFGSMSSAMGHARQLSSQEHRPPSSGMNATGRDDHELAAGIKMLSCSVNSAGGSCRAAAGYLPLDLAPPVPPFPAQFMNEGLPDASFINSFPSRATESFTRGPVRGEATWPGRMDVKMEEGGDDDEDVLPRSEEDFDLFSMDGP